MLLFSFGGINFDTISDGEERELANAFTPHDRARKARRKFAEVLTSLISNVKVSVINVSKGHALAVVRNDYAPSCLVYCYSNFLCIGIVGISDDLRQDCWNVTVEVE